MRIVALGRTQWLYDTITLLAKAGNDIVAVITAPAAPEYTRREDDFEELADTLKAKFLLCRRLDISVVKDMFSEADLGITVNWVSIINEEIINLFKMGILNAHCGDLPKYRGNACPNWAILNGEKEVALSVHFVEGEKLDCGKIIFQKKMELKEDTYIGNIYQWVDAIIPEAFLEAVKLLKQDPQYVLKYADVNAPDSFRCYPRKTEDGHIKWDKTAQEIQRLVRASSEPFFGAYCFIEKEPMREPVFFINPDKFALVKIYRAEVIIDREKYYAVPGQICEVGNNYFVVNTGSGKLKVTGWDCEIKIKSVRQRLL